MNSQYKGGRKQTVLNLIANMVSYAIGIAISFVLTPILLNQLGQAAYSFYPLSTQITNTMAVVATSLNSMASRYISINLMKGNEKEANRYYASTLFTDWLLSGVMLVFMTVFVIFIDTFLRIPTNLVASVRLLFIFTFSSMLVNIMSTVFGVATFAKNRIDLRSYREIGASVLRAVLFVVLFYVLPPSLVYIGIVALAISLFNLAVQYFLTKKLLPEVGFSRSNVSKEHIKILLTNSVWVMLNSLGTTLLNSVTLFMLNRFYTEVESSLVSVSLTIPGFISGIVATLVGVFFPVITKTYATGDISALRKEILKVQTIAGGIGAAIIGVFLPICSAFFGLWVPDQNTKQLAILSFINMIPYIFTACFWVSTSVNTVMAKVRVPAFATVGISLLNLMVQLLLGVFKVDYIWFPVSTMISVIVWNGVFMPLYLAKITATPWHYYYGTLIKLLGVLVAVYSLTFALSEFVVLNSWLKFILFGMIDGLVMLGLTFVVLEPKLFQRFYRRIVRR